MRRLIAATIGAAVLLGGVAAAQSNEPTPASELSYVRAQSGDGWWSLVSRHGLTCTNTELWAANGRTVLDPGTIVFLPPECTDDVAVTTTTTTQAPTTTQATTTTAAPTTTTTAPPSRPPGVHVDESAIPGPNDRALSVQRVLTTGQGGDPPADNVSAFRTTCRASHFGFVDPLLYPGVSRGSHLHLFYGNTSVDEHSDLDNLANVGASTCTGGTANRSSYWAPAIIDTATGEPIYSYAFDSAVEAYYKSGYQGVSPQTIEAFPPGLRMVAGASNADEPQPTNRVSWSCRITGNLRSELGTCPAGDELVMTVVFPQCWDGVNVDSADHRSHMAYGTWGPVQGVNGAGCPASHPVALPEITLNFRWPIGPSDDMSTWRLSSDVYDGPAGYSVHADWVNGWDQAILETWIDNCLAASPTNDCHAERLGDGRELDWQFHDSLT